MTEQFDLNNEGSERKLEKAREDIQNLPNQDKENKTEENETEKTFSGKDFFERAKVKESKIKLSLVGGVIVNVNNMKSAQEVRDKTAEKKMPEVIKALEEIESDLEKIKNNIKKILSVGAGWGENLKYLAEELKAEIVVGIDTNTIASKKVKEEMGDKLAWIKGDALEEMKRLEDNSFDLSELTAFLQVLNKEDKIKILKEIGRVSKLVVIVDELKRNGFDGFGDLLMNKLYNAGMGKYEIFDEEGWRGIFKEAGLVVVKEVFNKFGKNDFVAVLKKVEEKVKE